MHSIVPMWVRFSSPCFQTHFQTSRCVAVTVRHCEKVTPGLLEKLPRIIPKVHVIQDRKRWLESCLCVVHPLSRTCRGHFWIMYLGLASLHLKRRGCHWTFSDCASSSVNVLQLNIWIHQCSGTGTDTPQWLHLCINDWRKWMSRRPVSALICLLCCSAKCRGKAGVWIRVWVRGQSTSFATNSTDKRIAWPYVKHIWALFLTKYSQIFCTFADCLMSMWSLLTLLIFQNAYDIR